MKEKAIEILEEYASAYSDFNINTLTDILTEIKKETAKRILSELKTIVKSEYNTYNEKYSLDWNTGCDMGMGHLLWKIKEIVKEKYGVEVEE